MGSQNLKSQNLGIGIVMGSLSDWPIMQGAWKFLESLDIDLPKTYQILSAHRTPEEMLAYGKSAAQRGIGVIIAGAGGAAHLPGMIASTSILPVIGVPIRSSNSLDAWDSLLSIVQMPAGVPVATVAINGAKNAAILAIQILALKNPSLLSCLKNLKEKDQERVREQNVQLSRELADQPKHKLDT
ncbi:MAG: 5-(carboxyamino)imidazole ribonucleotide mutase [Cytophagales bacterium]|nr:5-(carboxyamino)imidazole ribonucleotide mutase [Cytophagales bacterium]